jgi:hypothetical protein
MLKLTNSLLKCYHELIKQKVLPKILKCWHENFNVCCQKNSFSLTSYCFCCRKLGLDLVPRIGAHMVDPDTMSVVELYHVVSWRMRLKMHPRGCNESWLIG